MRARSRSRASSVSGRVSLRRRGQEKERDEARTIDGRPDVSFDLL